MAKLAKMNTQDTVKGKEFKPKYAFEKRFVDKAQSVVDRMMTVDTTVVTEKDRAADYESKYAAYLAQYESEMAELQAKSNSIKRDVITKADEDRAILDHFEEEALLENSLGKRYLTKIEPVYKNEKPQEESTDKMEDSIIGDFMNKQSSGKSSKRHQ